MTEYFSSSPHKYVLSLGFLFSSAQHGSNAIMRSPYEFGSDETNLNFLLIQPTKITSPTKRHRLIVYPITTVRLKSDLVCC